ncbi:gp48 [Murine cytomegalovirus (strain K181)]|uniref:Gp48 n=4 Tax=Muromegalovirus muridbeta1 TaxID=3050323 RepID=A8E1I7_MUHVK
MPSWSDTLTMDTTARGSTRSRPVQLLALVTVLASMTFQMGESLIPIIPDFSSFMMNPLPMPQIMPPSTNETKETKESYVKTEEPIVGCNVSRTEINRLKNQMKKIPNTFKCFKKDGVRTSLDMQTTGEKRFACEIPNNVYVNATWYVHWVVGKIAASVSPIVYFTSTTSSPPTLDGNMHPFYRRKIVTAANGFKVDEKTGDITVARSNASLADSVRCRLIVCLWTKNDSISDLPDDDPQMKNMSGVIKLPDYSGPDTLLTVPFDYAAWRQRMRTEMEEPSRRRRQLLLVISVIASLLWLAVGAMLFYTYGREPLARLLKRYGKRLAAVRIPADGKDQSLTSPLLTK